MALKDYMLDGEQIEASCSGPVWEWMATSERVARYTVDDSGSSKTEMFEDVSYGEVSSLSLTADVDPWYKRLAAVLVGLGLLAGLVGFQLNETTFFGLALVLVIGGVFLFVYGVARVETTLELRGPAVLAGGSWSMQTEDSPPEEVAEFMRAVRERID